MKLQVQDILAVDIMRDSKLVAGAQGIIREVTNISIMETYDAPNWYNGGELVLTAGYFINIDDSLKNIRLIRSLSDHNVAALGLKIGLHLREIPQSLLQEAERCHLPIISIPFHISWSNIINNVMPVILGQKTNLFLNAEKVCRSINRTIMEGYGLEGICRVLTEHLDMPCVLLGSKYEVLARSTPPKLYRQRFLSSYLIYKDNHIYFKFDEAKNNCLIYPIVIDDVTYGYLILWNIDDNDSGLLNMVAEYACSAASQEIIKKKYTNEIKSSFRSDILDRVLLNRFDDEKQLAAYLKILDLEVNDMASVIIVKHNLQISDSEEIDISSFIVQCLKRYGKANPEYRKRWRQAIICDKKSSSILILPAHKEGIPDKNDLIVLCRYIKLQMEKEFADSAIIIGIGSLKKVEQINRSYIEAIKIIELGNLIDRDDNVIHFDDIEVYYLLDSLTNKAYLQEYVNKTIGRIPDDESNLLTIYTYLQCHTSITETAKALNIHVNTLKYRLGQIKKRYNIDFSNPDQLFSLQLAIKAKKIIDMDSSALIEQQRESHI